MQPSFLSGGTTPRRLDTDWTEAQRWLGALQNRPCADPRNNGRRTDSYWRTLYKIAASINGCLPVSPVPPVVCTSAEIVGTGDFVGDGSAFDLYSMAVNGADAVAVGSGGEVVTSPDGQAWTGIPSITAGNLWAVAYGNGTWVAVGDGGKAFTSPDATTWTQHSLSEPGVLYGVTFGGGLFVAVNDGGRIWSSPDGATWTERASYGDVPIYNVIYGNGLFVAVGVTGFISTSPDGLTWTEQVSGLAEDLFSVAYTNGVFVAVSGVSLTALYSTDGAVWQQAAIPSSDSTVYDVAGGGGIFVTITQETGQVWVSSNGSTWTRQLPDLCPTVFMVDFYGGCQFNVSLPYLPAESGGQTSLAADLGSTVLFAIDSNADRICACGVSGRLRVSDNGICWESRTSGTTKNLEAIGYGNGVWVCGGQAENDHFVRLLRSTDDGETWPTVNPFPEFAAFESVAFGLGLFVADVPVQFSGQYIYTSPNGITWTQRRTVTEGNTNSILFVDGRFWAVGGTDMVLVSTDAMTWTAVTIGTTGVGFFSLASNANGSVLILVGDDPGFVYRSTNGGTSWAPVAVPQQMYGVDFGNGVFVMAPDNDDTIYVSSDGLTWTILASNWLERHLPMYYKDSTFIVV